MRSGLVKRTEWMINEPVLFGPLSVHYALNFQFAFRSIFSDKLNAERIKNISILDAFVALGRGGRDVQMPCICIAANLGSIDLDLQGGRQFFPCVGTGYNCRSWWTTSARMEM